LKLKYSNPTRTYHISTIDCQKKMAVKLLGEIVLTIHYLKATFHSSMMTMLHQRRI